MRKCKEFRSKGKILDFFYFDDFVDIYAYSSFFGLVKIKIKIGNEIETPPSGVAKK